MRATTAQDKLSRPLVPVSHIHNLLLHSLFLAFKRIILSLESAPTPSQPTPSQPIPANLLQLFQQLSKVLESPPLLRAYGNLIPLRLRSAFQHYLSTRDAAASLKWTSSADNADDDDINMMHDSKRIKLNPSQQQSQPKIPIFQDKTIVRPQ